MIKETVYLQVWGFIAAPLQGKSAWHEPSTCLYVTEYPVEDKEVQV